MPTDAEFLRRAIKLAIHNVRSGDGGPFAAVIVRNGQIVGEVANSVTRTLDATAHGEINAIRDACRRTSNFLLTGCTLYTSCEPCPMCLAACYWAQIERVVYGASQDDAAAAGFGDAALYREFVLPAAERALLVVGMLQKEALAAFQAWQASEHRIDYGSLPKH
jgi:tRNA(Arg) A34 adenosine deaminase TadA